MPVAPLAEQVEICSRLEKLLRVADRLTASRANLMTSQLSLDQSVLAKAFRGGLVTQDPNDEPAEVMLARVRSVNGSTSSDTKSKRGRRASNVPDADSADE